MSEDRVKNQITSTTLEVTRKEISRLEDEIRAYKVQLAQKDLELERMTATLEKVRWEKESKKSKLHKKIRELQLQLKRARDSNSELNETVKDLTRANYTLAIGLEDERSKTSFD